MSKGFSYTELLDGDGISDSSGPPMKLKMPTFGEKLARHILYLDPRSPDYAKDVFAACTGALNAQDELITYWQGIVMDGAHLRPPEPIMFCAKCGKDLRP